MTKIYGIATFYEDNGKKYQSPCFFKTFEGAAKEVFEMAVRHGSIFDGIEPGNEATFKILCYDPRTYDMDIAIIENGKHVMTFSVYTAYIED